MGIPDYGCVEPSTICEIADRKICPFCVFAVSTGSLNRSSRERAIRDGDRRRRVTVGDSCVCHLFLLRFGRTIVLQCMSPVTWFLVIYSPDFVFCCCSEKSAANRSTG